MHVLSLPFFGLVVGSVLLYWFVVPARWRVALLALVSVIFCATHAPAFTGLYVVLGVASWQAGRWLQSDRPDRTRQILLTAGLVFLVLDLVLFKFGLSSGPIEGTGGRAAIPSYEQVVVPVGLSYLTFRLIHYLVERYRGGLPDRPLSELLAWLFFFPVFLCGPLMRFGEWAEQTVERPRMADINQALLRIGMGVVKKALLADTLGLMFQPVLLDPTGHPPLSVVLAVYAVALQLYLDFSGYTDIAIGLGRLFGYRVPENFDKPLLSPNIAEFWRRWHITLYTWIRDYVFFPLFGYKTSPLKMYLGAAVSIFLFQVWHALSPGFIALGIWHGVAVVAWQLLQAQKRKRPKWRKGFKKHKKKLAPVGIALTVSWYAFGNVLFMTSPSHLWGVLVSLGG
jgi:alginate O-acetyltransferase complex protein AlgI